MQGFAQIPDLTVWYGPDTYMGRNLAQLFTSLAELPDEEVQKLHPKHTQASVKALLPRLHYFEEGTELVRKAYGDAYLTAHFEVRFYTLRNKMSAAISHFQSESCHSFLQCCCSAVLRQGCFGVLPILLATIE